MTNDKKLKSKDLAKVKGGAAKTTTAKTVVKASMGRTSAPASSVKGVNLGTKRG